VILVGACTLDEKYLGGNFATDTYPKIVKDRIIYAPSLNIFDHTFNYYAFKGTSLSAPLVTSTIALVASLNNAISMTVAAEIVLKSSIPIPRGFGGEKNVSGRGLLSIKKAITEEKI
jgi:hypothetical protein